MIVVFGFVDLVLSEEFVFDNVGIGVVLEEEWISLNVCSFGFEKIGLYELDLSLFVLDFDLYDDGCNEIWKDMFVG